MQIDATTAVMNPTHATENLGSRLIEKDLEVQENVYILGTLYMGERAAADADIAGVGQLWVKNTTPCELWFTDDAGTDTKLA